MDFEITGLDELQNKLEDIIKNSNKLKNAEVKLDNLFTETFMSKYTNFSNLNEFFKAGNFVVSSQEDFHSIPKSELDIHVRETTEFSSWQNMLDKAGELYSAKQLAFD